MSSRSTDLPEHYYAQARRRAPRPCSASTAPRSFFAATGANILHGGSRACYVPSTDNIHMPCIEFFRDAESYYATLAHETTHWTRHPIAASTAISGASALATKATRWRSLSPSLAPPSCPPTST